MTDGTGLAAQQGGEITTVELDRRQGRAGERGEGGQEVEMPGDGSRAGAGGNGAGPPGEGGDAQAALVGLPLRAAQRGVLRAVVEGATVVAGVDHQGVFSEPELAQQVEDASGAGIEFLGPVA